MPRSAAARTSTQSQPVAATEMMRQRSSCCEHGAVERDVVGQDRVGFAAGGDEGASVAAVGEGLDVRVGGQVPALDRQVAALRLRHLGENDGRARAAQAAAFAPRRGLANRQGQQQQRGDQESRPQRIDGEHAARAGIGRDAPADDGGERGAACSRTRRRPARGASRSAAIVGRKRPAELMREAELEDVDDVAHLPGHQQARARPRRATPACRSAASRAGAMPGWM